MDGRWPLGGPGSAPGADAALLGLLAAAGEPLSSHILARLAQEAAGRSGVDAAAALDRAPESDLAIIDRELARLFAVRELFLTWVQELRQDGAQSPGDAAAPRGLSPAQFMRAWSDSTGRVIQLLRARRDLGGARSDALLDAVYAELEALLPGPGEGDSLDETRGAAGAPRGAQE